MSEFSRLTQKRGTTRPARRLPSALQMAWALVVLVFGGTLLWLSLSAPPPTPRPSESQKAPSQKPAHVPLQTALGTPQAAASSPLPPSGLVPVKPAVKLAPTAEPVAESIARPDPGLITDGTHGPLPIIGADGRKAWQVYARPFGDPQSRPRIAIVVSGLGLSEAVTSAAINDLPGAVTLSFSPYADDLADWAQKAREAHHETMVMIPMEPESYPQNDPGPKTLLTTLDADRNLDRLYWAMGRFEGYVGVINEMGSKFTASENDMRPIAADLAKRGVLYVDSRASRFTIAARLMHAAGVPTVLNDRYLDNSLTPDALAQQLAALETVAQANGVAVGVGHAYPVTIKAISRWAKDLTARGFVLAPVSAVANLQVVN